MLKLLTDPLEETSPSLSVQDKTSNNLVLDGFLRREDLARQLGVSPRTIDRWQVLREGPPRVSVGRTVLYNVESVREWLRSREQQAFPTRKRRNFSGVKP
jgi:predicted DNA-binding transcriptional regulator AlpA